MIRIRPHGRANNYNDFEVKLGTGSAAISLGRVSVSSSNYQYGTTWERKFEQRLTTEVHIIVYQGNKYTVMEEIEFFTVHSILD